MNDDKNFLGFGDSAFQFLADIEQNNNREWFAENKHIYQAELELPAKNLLENLKSSLIILTDREMDGKIFRFYRDVRFSKDKSPYKTNVRMLLYPAGRTQQNSGDIPIFYFSIEADIVRVGVGVMQFDKPTLDKFRKAMVDEELAADFLTIVNGLFKQGFTVNDPSLKRVQSGYDKDNKNAQ